MAREGQILNTEGEIAKAGCVVIDNRSRVILVTNAERSAYGIPKGHAEAGESLEETARREVLEETGYEVEFVERLNDLVYRHGQTGEPIRVALWLARPKAGTEPRTETDEQCAWMELRTAQGLVKPNEAEVLAEVIQKLDS